MEQFPATKPNPVLKVAKDGTVLYSNEAGGPLLKKWGVEIKDKLPSNIVDIVRRVIFRNSPEKVEVKVENRVYLVVFHPFLDEECVNISGFEISDQNHFEEKLLESERRYHLLFENMLDGFAYCKLLYDEYGHPVDFIYLDTNKAFEQLTSLKKVNGKRATEVFPGIKESHPELLETYSRVASTGKPEKFEIEFKPLGAWLSISVYSTEKEHFVAVFDNITERKQAEEALQESEGKYRNIIETANEGVWMFNSVSETTYVNEKMAKMLGYSREEMVGSLIWDYADEEDKGIFEAKLANRKQGIDEVYELKLMRKEGSYIWVLVSAKALYDKDGKFAGSLGMFTDITDRKLAEETLNKAHASLEAKVKARTEELEKAYKSLKESEKNLAEAQKMAHIGSWDNDLLIGKLCWSEEMYHIFGLSSQEPMTYDKFLSHVHPDDRDYVYNSTKEAFNGKTYATVYRIVRPDGEERIVHSEREVIFNERNNPVQMRGTIQDITERKKVEEELAKMEKIRIKEIHHRIKNNLQVISSLLDLQVGKFSHLEVCKVPEVIEAFTESQNRVVSMALIHEELYKGNNIGTLDFAAYLKKLTKNLFRLYTPDEKDINLKLDLEQVTLGMDTAIPLGIIVNELISNSFKHAFPAGRKGEILVKLSRTENLATKNEISGLDKDFKEKNSFGYILKISDNGKGIPQEIDLENVDSLGLQLVNILVKQLEGILEIKSNTGTEFTIWFNELRA